MQVNQVILPLRLLIEFQKMLTHLGQETEQGAIRPLVFELNNSTIEILFRSQRPGREQSVRS